MPKRPESPSLEPGRRVKSMPHVLVLNGYPDEGEMYVEYLRAVGVRADYVSTPEEALLIVQTQPPAVIVTDMVFPGSAWDGLRFVRAVRALPSCARTNCIMVSGYPWSTHRELARQAGADLFLLKPCAPDELHRHVTRAVGLDS